MKSKRNDEWDYTDALGHYPLVKSIGQRLLGCEPPYVIGICGSWGAGKTSFLRKLWAYLGGQVEQDDGKIKNLDQMTEKLDDREVKGRFKWFGETKDQFDKVLAGKNVELVWFNPWQHQFESSPLVALLGEIRHHFTLTRKLFDEAGKLANVSIHATLNSMTEVAKDLKIPFPSAKSVMERGQEYEAENFSTVLGSQRFRDFFEGAIESVTEKSGKKGLLVIFIDDLDRCEGDVSYRLLEALKLYLNAKNCVYVLGIDQQHLETSIAKALSGEKETWKFRPLARDYLSKMFQSTFHLPVPRNASYYVDELLGRNVDFQLRLRDLFGMTITDFKNDDWHKLVQALERNLPHNPRKMKSFVASWKTYLDVLMEPKPAEGKLDWRLTIILQYLAQFEEPLYRRVEQFPNFYNQHLLPFCQGQLTRPHPLFDGLELAAEEAIGIAATAAAAGTATGTATMTSESGALAIPVASAAAGQAQSDAQPLPEPRFFWISRLINEVAKDFKTIDPENIRRHLPQAAHG